MEFINLTGTDLAPEFHRNSKDYKRMLRGGVMLRSAERNWVVYRGQVDHDKRSADLVMTPPQLAFDGPRRIQVSYRVHETCDNLL